MEELPPNQLTEFYIGRNMLFYKKEEYGIFLKHMTKLSTLNAISFTGNGELREDIKLLCDNLSFNTTLQTKYECIFYIYLY